MKSSREPHDICTVITGRTAIFQVGGSELVYICAVKSFLGPRGSLANQTNVHFNFPPSDDDTRSVYGSACLMPPAVRSFSFPFDLSPSKAKWGEREREREEPRERERE